MNTFDPNIHHRRSIRLKGYDYAQAGLYFITICCQDRAHLFGRITNGEMKWNEAGKIAHNEWLHTTEIRDNISLHEFIVMPNHFHAIIEILFSKNNAGKLKPAEGTDLPSEDTTDSSDQKEKDQLQFASAFKSPSQTIGSIIRGYKIATTKQIKDLFISDGNINNRGTGELQFAPTAPTTPTARKTPTNKIWQRNYYEIIIRNEQAYHTISNYIINNPAKWKEDKFYSR